MALDIAAIAQTAEDDAFKAMIFDSLPYYDNDLEQHPILKEKVEKELAREAKQPQGLHPHVPPSPKLFANNPLLEAELARVESRQPLPPLDTLRYQLPAPTSTPASEEEWRAALNNARVQLEHQRLRHSNLALLQQYGPNAWRIHNYLVEGTAKNLEKALEDLQNMTTELNRDRKNFQTQIGAQLTSLETRWTELISSILQIEIANAALETEIDRLDKTEAELAAGM
ncbi:breast carcinoma amplified sequence 2 [Obba rivulosa]|uniref:Breast carcinoma amplified sequence 2 n=1 Tax=Obba rivulosa TaxID=1052685 RepID=A0A8E2DVU6_9APHY|nr:breast carcinoma amplified sequence 2 [Obba rivulosa]